MILKGRCKLCGCEGIHACMGAPTQPMTADQLDQLEAAILDIINSENEGSDTMTLTKEQIKRLAIYSGFNVQDISGTDVDTEFEIRNASIKGEDNQPDYNGLVAYNKDYPEDGAIPLD